MYAVSVFAAIMFFWGGGVVVERDGSDCNLLSYLRTSSVFMP